MSPTDDHVSHARSSRGGYRPKIEQDECCLGGCDEPRKVNSNGIGRYRYCHEHNAARRKPWTDPGIDKFRSPTPPTDAGGT